MSEESDLRTRIEGAALRYLALREHSRLELQRKLLAKSFPVPEVETVLDELADKGLQSDTRFAECFVRSRMNRGYGNRRIAEELRQRGIAREDQPDFMEQDWGESLLRVYVKKYGHTPPLSPSERASRENFLRGRGFSGDQIRHLLRHLTQSHDANDL